MNTLAREEVESGLKLFSIGVVSQDKDTDSDVIRVYLVEKLNFEVGEVDTNQEKLEGVMGNLDGVPYKASVNRESVLEATWFPNGADGRMTSPDVVSGEHVKIYRYKNTDQFYWSTMYREPSLRRLEHVAFAYGNLPSGRSAFGLDSSYGQIWSTKNQYVKFYTTQSNGEAFAYSFKIDAKNSLVELKDNVGNGLDVQSVLKVVGIQNDTGTRMEVNETEINTKADGSIGNYTPLSWYSGAISVTGLVHCAGLAPTIGRPGGSEPSFVSPMARGMGGTRLPIDFDHVEFKKDIKAPHLIADEITIEGMSLRDYIRLHSN